MLIELIIVPRVRSKQTKVLNIYAVYFTTVYLHKGSALEIVTIIIMSVGKVYYYPEHAAG
jgi:hypothetical protein